MYIRLYIILDHRVLPLRLATNYTVSQLHLLSLSGILQTTLHELKRLVELWTLRKYGVRAENSQRHDMQQTSDQGQGCSKDLEFSLSPQVQGTHKCTVQTKHRSIERAARTNRAHFACVCTKSSDERTESVKQQGVFALTISIAISAGVVWALIKSRRLSASSQKRFHLWITKQFGIREDDIAIALKWTVLDWPQRK